MHFRIVFSLSLRLLLRKSHLRAPFVRFADIFPADGEINPHQREAWGDGL